jgi:energy-coupling factor transporter ATP-binding protein EcfA2
MENSLSNSHEINPDSNETIKASSQQIISGGVSFGQGNIVNVGRDVIGTLHGYTHEQVIELVNALREGEEEPSYSGRPPYLGLEAYQEEDADLFFGREKLTDELIKLLQPARFLCLAGPSGSGKSSLARAGLIPALRSGGAIPGSEKWLYSSLLPGDQPLENLAKAVSRLALSSGMDFQAAGDRLRKNGQDDPSLLSTLVDLLTQSTPGGMVLLLVDQFEQVFSPSCDSDQAAAFVAQLIHAAQLENCPLKTILTLRSDYLGQCAAYPPLRELINRGFQLVGAMSVEELARAITLPPLQVGVEVQAELVQQVIADMQSEPGALPLMQFALRDLFEAQNPRQGDQIQLTQQGYLKRGGIWGALRRHADDNLRSLPPEDQDIANLVFTHLIAIGPDQAATRRAASRAELVASGVNEDGLDRVLDSMIMARLLIAEGEEQDDNGSNSEVPPQVWYTLAHDRLIDSWPWLAQLVEGNRQAIALTSQIESDAQAWEEEARDSGYLYRGAKLEAAQIQKGNLSLSSRGLKFLDQSQAQQEAEQRKSISNRLRDSALRGLGGGAAGFGLGYLLLTWNQIYGLDLWIINILIFASFWGVLGALAGLITSLGAMLSISVMERGSSLVRYLVGGMFAASGYVLALFVFALLSNKGSSDLPLILLEGALWGFVTGLGLIWASNSHRPLWLKSIVLGLSGGLIFMLIENFAEAYQRPNTAEINIWLTLIAGALVPICLLLALSVGKPLIREARKS